MNTMRFLFSLALLAQVWAGSAQIYFSKQLDWQHDYDLMAGLSVFDSNRQILLSGGTYGLTPPSSQFFLTKVDSIGGVIWQTSFQPVPGAYGNTSNVLKLDEKYSLIQGNAQVVGNTGTVNYQLFFMKVLNETGDTIWVKQIGAEHLEEGVTKMIQTTDHQFSMTGESFPVDNSQRSKVLLLKIDSLGNQIFRKEYTSDYGKNHHAFSLAQAADGGYLLLAYRSYNGPYLGGFGNENKIDLVLIKTDAQGNQQWLKIFEPWEWKQILLYGTDIQILTNGNFLVSGLKSYAAYLPGYSYYAKYLLLKFNSQGEIIDSVSLPGNYYFFRINRLKPSGDGNFWAIGAERDSSTTAQTGLIMKITPDLQVLWKREYRVSPPESLIHEIFYEGAPLPDKGFVLCGRAFGPIEDSTNQNGWVIRVDSLGCLEPGCDTVITAVGDPPQEADAGILLSPNPTGGEVRLALTDPEAVLLGARLLDVQGRVLEDVQFRREAKWRECVLSLAGQPAGVYVVQVRASKGWVVRKVFKY